MKQSNRLRAFAKAHNGCACKCDASCKDKRAKCAQKHDESAQDAKPLQEGWREGWLSGKTCWVENIVCPRCKQQTTIWLPDYPSKSKWECLCCHAFLLVSHSSGCAPSEVELMDCLHNAVTTGHAEEKADILPRTARIYIASPYTNSNSLARSLDVHVSMMAADELWRMGYTPFLPLLAHYWDLVFPRDYEEWMQWGLRWLRKCEAVVRLLGESKRADREVALAESVGIPVYYYSLEDLKQLDFLPYS